MHHEPLSFYFAGDLFDAKDLVGNALLAEAIHSQSDKRYLPVLPQNLEQRETSAHSIRDNDLLCLLECDLGLFHFDGSELDSGTVVEFMVAKFADIPSVVLRTDFRAKGDQQDHPWNLMASFYPRTEVVVLDAMGIYQKGVGGGPVTDPLEIMESAVSQRRGAALLEKIAEEVISRFDRLRDLPPCLPGGDAEAVYRWLALMPNFRAGAKTAGEIIDAALRRKVDRGLL